VYELLVTVEDAETALTVALHLGSLPGVSVTSTAPAGKDQPKANGKPRKLGRQAKARQRWTTEEEGHVVIMQDEQRSIAYMARELGRSKDAVKARLMYEIHSMDAQARAKAAKAYKAQERRIDALAGEAE